jgi:hypothetical protein
LLLLLLLLLLLATRASRRTRAAAAAVVPVAAAASPLLLLLLRALLLLRVFLLLPLIRGRRGCPLLWGSAVVLGHSGLLGDRGPLRLRLLRLLLCRRRRVVWLLL